MTKGSCFSFTLIKANGHKINYQIMNFIKKIIKADCLYSTLHIVRAPNPLNSAAPFAPMLLRSGWCRAVAGRTRKFIIQTGAMKGRGDEGAGLGGTRWWWRGGLLLGNFAMTSACTKQHCEKRSVLCFIYR